MLDAPDTSAIAIRQVSKVFGTGDDRVTALAEVEIDIRANEFFTLLGPSGCGKTTLLRLIAGFDYPTTGEIRLYGEDIARLPPYKRPINTVFQNYALFPHMTVGQNIGFGLEMLGKPKAEIAPKVLLLDEPLSALDYKLRKEMQLELKRLQHETGITFIFVTHDQEEALTMSDRIAVMSKGHVLQIGSAHEIYDKPSERFVANFIGETNFLEGAVIAIDGANASVRLGAGATLSAGVPDGFAPRGRTTVVIRPEHAEVVAPSGAEAFAGTVANVVYFGTDTHYYVTLDGGEEFMVRRQNSRGAQVFDTGARVGIRVDEGAARVLRD